MEEVVDEMKSKVTFLMMAYNTENYVEKAVRSVLNQTETQINIIVRDNGSTDNTGNILDALAKEDSRLRVIHNRVNGITDEGIKTFEEGWWFDQEPEGEYVSIIDSDDWLTPDFVEKTYVKALEVDADICFAGNYFVEEGKVTGQRIPPRLKSSLPQDIGDDFKDVHRCFRTWWGKLFKKSFFISNYHEAWSPQSPMWWCVDTVIMLNYLSKAKSLAAVCEPLYNMRLRNNSTYTIRAIEFGRIMEAYTIYEAMYKVVEQFDIVNKDNVEYLENVHWGYLKEVFVEIPKNKEMSVQEKYWWFQSMLADDISSSYIKKDFPTYLFQIKPILEDIARENASENIYTNYLARLDEFVNMIGEDDRNPLAYSILLGVLCDPKNPNRFGMDFLHLPLRAHTKGTQKVNEFHSMVKKKWMLIPGEWVLNVSFSDLTEDVVELEKRLIASKDEEERLDLAINIVMRFPLDLFALVYITKTYEKSGNMKDYYLLRETIINIWTMKEIDYVKKVLF